MNSTLSTDDKLSELIDLLYTVAHDVVGFQGQILRSVDLLEKAHEYGLDIHEQEVFIRHVAEKATLSVDHLHRALKYVMVSYKPSEPIWTPINLCDAIDVVIDNLPKSFLYKTVDVAVSNDLPKIRTNTNCDHDLGSALSYLVAPTSKFDHVEICEPFELTIDAKFSNEKFVEVTIVASLQISAYEINSDKDKGSFSLGSELGLMERVIAQHDGVFKATVSEQSVKYHIFHPIWVENENH